jgi:TRAP-type C4-dicarboxylate transport system permease small subunit
MDAQNGQESARPEHPAVIRLVKITEWIAERFSNLASLVLLWLVGLTVVDVVGRYFLRMPVTGAVELVQISMAGIIFFSMPMMFLKEDQVVVDLFQFVRRGWLGWVLSILITLVVIGASWIVADRVWDYAVRAYEDQDATIYLDIPRYLTVSFITISIYVSAVFAGVRVIRLLFRPGRVIPDETGREFQEN